uniref:Intradiol ring-cleavage dioxygenases domain-containing protein n=1 Tax=Phytophthora ramorum TaxID=164328 RepID=H3GU55_PHYRM
MFKLIVLLCVALVALVAHDASAVHPVAQQVARTEAQDAGRQRFLSHSQRLLTACTNSEAGRKLQEQNAARRSAKLKELLASRRLDATTVSATSHKTNLTGVTTSTYPEYLFGDDDSVKCVLAPETTQDTFYVSGELYRQDITEDQTGVSLSTELQFIDVNTCTPVSDLWIDFWHSNALGVYSGVAGSEAGESTETSNVDATFLRGLVQTDSYGLTGFTSIFPGHYAGRAPHIDIVATYRGSFQSNNTYTGGSVVHAGEIFFDQDLITEVEETSTYVSNSQNLTTNEADKGFTEATATGYDPIMEYALIGDSVGDGVFAWISIGVDLTASNNVTAVGALTADGGVQYR